MRTKLLSLVIIFLLAGANVFAADGDLVVSGDVGIGTASSQSSLHIAAYGGGIILQDPLHDMTDPAAAAWVTFLDKNGSQIGYFGDGGTGKVMDLAGESGYGLQFSAGGHLRMVIEPAYGNVGIGTANPSYTLHVNGEIYSSGGYAGSDIRWKKNITLLENSLGNVLKLQGVSYEWKTEEYKDKNFDEGKQIGLIAQEVEKVIPELVSTDNEGYKAVSYEKLTAVLVEAIKEQQKKIAELENRIKMLEK